MMNARNDINISAQITSYDDEKFLRILKLDNISFDEVMQSLSLESNRQNVFKAGEGAGQSGSFFFFSRDNRFLIKTMNKQERNILLGMLDDMVEYLE